LASDHSAPLDTRSRRSPVAVSSTRIDVRPRAERLEDEIPLVDPLPRPAAAVSQTSRVAVLREIEHEHGPRRLRPRVSRRVCELPARSARSPDSLLRRVPDRSARCSPHRTRGLAAGSPCGRRVQTRGTRTGPSAVVQRNT
jgi:hypothetical protein